MQIFEELLFKRLDNLEEKLDQVRTETLPAIKVDIALIAERDRMNNKIFSGVTSIVAVLASVFLNHAKK